MGGYDDFGAVAVNTVQAYDPTADSWSAVPPMKTAGRGDMGTALGVDGSIYAIGGGNSDGPFITAVERYSPATNTWASVADLPQPRQALAAATLPDGRILAMGGYVCCYPTLATVDAYTPATDSWAPVAPMSTPRNYLAAAAGLDGRVYAIGGSDGAFGLASVEAYDAASDTWTPVAPMPGPRSLASATTGTDGRIYVVGGRDDASQLSSVIAYDPSTNTWSTVAPLPATRERVAVATGSDGRVYVVGGWGSSATSLTTVEALTVVDPCDAVSTPSAPVFSGSPDGAAGWYKTTPVVSATAPDAAAAYALVSGGPYGAAPSLSDGVTTVYAIATSATCGKQSAEASRTYRVDTTAPSVDLVGGPAGGGTYAFGAVPVAPSCVASDATSVVASCLVSGYSAAVGSHTVVATAVDGAGNSKAASRAYTVASWTAAGFYHPVDMNGVVNIVKGGATVPLKFEVFSGPTELTSTTVVDTFKQAVVPCAGGAPTDEVEVTTTGGTTLRYDTAGGQFVQNWQTPKAAGACYTITLTLDDGSKLIAKFRLK
jgi:hypothetical protein